MTQSKAFENRRQEPRRQYLPKAPVAWRRHGGVMWHRGWLNDISASGASLLLSAPSQPRAGQEIDLRRRDSGAALLCRVVRTQVGRGSQSVVACRVVSADGCPAFLSSAPRAGTAHRHAARRAWPVGVWPRNPRGVALRSSA